MAYMMVREGEREEKKLASCPEPILSPDKNNKEQTRDLGSRT